MHKPTYYEALRRDYQSEAEQGINYPVRLDSGEEVRLLAAALKKLA